MFFWEFCRIRHRYSERGRGRGEKQKEGLEEEEKKEGHTNFDKEKRKDQRMKEFEKPRVKQDPLPKKGNIRHRIKKLWEKRKIRKTREIMRNAY